MAPCDFPELITVGGIAAELRINPRTVRRWVIAGSFPKPFRLGKRVSRWNRADVVCWLESQKK